MGNLCNLKKQELFKIKVKEEIISKRIIDEQNFKIKPQNIIEKDKSETNSKLGQSLTENQQAYQLIILDKDKSDYSLTANGSSPPTHEQLTVIKKRG